MASGQSVSRRRHSSAVSQSPPAAVKTATRRKAASVDETCPSLPSKQPVVELSPLSDSKLSSVAATAAPTVVCQQSCDTAVVHMTAGVPASPEVCDCYL